MSFNRSLKTDGKNTYSQRKLNEIYTRKFENINEIETVENLKQVDKSKIQENYQFCLEKKNQKQSYEFKVLFEEMDCPAYYRFFTGKLKDFYLQQRNLKNDEKKLSLRIIKPKRPSDYPDKILFHYVKRKSREQIDNQQTQSQDYSENEDSYTLNMLEEALEEESQDYQVDEDEDEYEDEDEENPSQISSNNDLNQLEEVIEEEKNNTNESIKKNKQSQNKLPNNLEKEKIQQNIILFLDEFFKQINQFDSEDQDKTIENMKQKLRHCLNASNQLIIDYNLNKIKQFKALCKSQVEF
ncbi:hypothetical protein ABPG74_009395 [Tetrahymena malaccensis]